MKLTVFGAGYVGLVSGTGLAELGHEVLCVDQDGRKIDQLNRGEVPIHEPGLADLIRRSRRSGRLHFSAHVEAPFDRADAYFICVGTPAKPNGECDVSAVFGAAEQIASLAKSGDTHMKSALVVVKSTVPVGTCDALQEQFSRTQRAHELAFEVVSNPEFLKEGDAVADFFKPDRIVLGARTDAARQALRELYAPLQLSGERLVMTDPRSSELIKYASNTMLAMRVSFMNELSRLCHLTGANIHSVRLGVGADSRIGKKFLFAGPGYGGSCFPKDVQALTALGKKHGLPMRLAEATHLANDEQKQFVTKLVYDALGTVEKKKIAFWGLAFKPETDDVRDSPAVMLAANLLSAGARIVGHDPEAGANFKRALDGRVEVTDREYDALDGAHALVLLTEWRCYRAPNFDEIKKRLVPGPNGAPLVLDARNIWRPSEVARAGLRYQAVGVRADH